MNKEEEFKKYIERRKEKTNKKINPILQAYKDGKMTKKEYIDELEKTFHDLEEDFMEYDNIKGALDSLWREGLRTLDIYYMEDIHPGDEKWFVDICQDDINELCHSNWTWTIISKKEYEDEKEDDISEWEILVDNPFSEELIIETIEKWLREREYEFKVKIIPIEDAKGIIIKELRERLEKYGV